MYAYINPIRLSKPAAHFVLVALQTFEQLEDTLFENPHHGHALETLRFALGEIQVHLNRVDDLYQAEPFAGSVDHVLPSKSTPPQTNAWFLPDLQNPGNPSRPGEKKGQRSLI